MKQGREFGGGDGGGGGEDLRTMLRQWRAPAPSPGIEEELRRTFRRARSRGRRSGWLALAAGVSIAAVLGLLLNRAGKTPVQVAGRPTLLPSSPPPPPLVHDRGVVEGPRLASPAPAKRPRSVRRARDEVIVEPRQAELLAELARQWRDTRQAGPGLSLPRIEVMPADAPPGAILQAQGHDQVPEYRARWENVESEWPLAHWAL